MEFRIIVNEVARDTDNENLYRILWVSPEAEYGYWIKMDGRNGMPSQFSCAELPEWGASERAVREELRETLYDMEDIPPKAIAQRERIWNALGRILQMEPEIYDRIRRGELVREVREQTGIDRHC